jgi:hypothetical protein
VAAYLPKTGERSMIFGSPALQRFGLALAIAAGGFSYRGTEPGSASDRTSSGYRQTAADLERISAAAAKRLRRQARNLEVMYRPEGFSADRYWKRSIWNEKRAFRQNAFLEKLTLRAAA